MVGALAIAGLPPLNGFASEWLILQSLLHAASAGGLGIALAALGATAALATTAALAAFSFVKATGIALFGEPRTQACAEATEAPASIRLAMLSLAAACVALGVAPGLLLPELAGLAPGAAGQARDVGIHVPGTGGLSTPALALLLGALVVVLHLARGRRVAAPRRHGRAGSSSRHRSAGSRPASPRRCA